MGSDDDMFRIWSGPEGSSHKEPLSGIRIHRAHGLSFCAVLPNRAMLDAARHPERQVVIQKARHDQKVYALPFSCQLVALGGARWLCQNIDGYAVQEAAKCLVSRWSSAAPAGSLDYQIPRHRPGPVVQKSPVKARLSNLIYPLRNAACWFCLGIDGYVVQEAAVLLLAFLQLKGPVSLGGETGLFLSLGLWIGEGRMLCRLF